MADFTTTSWSAPDAALIPDEHILTWQWATTDSVTILIDAGHHTFRPAGSLDWVPTIIQADTVRHGVRLTTDAPAVGVWLRSAAEGRFEDNGFILLPDERRVVQFFGPSGEPADPGEIRVVHFAEVQAQASAL